MYVKKLSPKYIFSMKKCKIKNNMYSGLLILWVFKNIYIYTHKFQLHEYVTPLKG